MPAADFIGRYARECSAESLLLDCTLLPRALSRFAACSRATADALGPSNGIPLPPSAPGQVVDTPYAPESFRGMLLRHRGRSGLTQRSFADRAGASGGGDGTLQLWDTHTGRWLRALRPERRYEHMDITGLTGVTSAQRAALLALGAVETSA